MDRTRQQGLGVLVIALAVVLGQLPSLVTVSTDPSVSAFDRGPSVTMVLSALSLFVLGWVRLRNPEWFDDGSPGREFRPLPIAIIAGGLFGIGVLLYTIVP